MGDGKFDPEFGFDEPMLAIHWTLWQTVAWIVDCDPNSVRKYTGPPWDIDRMRRKFWRRKEFDYELTKAFAALARTFESGDIVATGVTPDGTRREIAPMEWCDLEWAAPTGEEMQLYEKRNLRNLQVRCVVVGALAFQELNPAFQELRLRREDVLRIFPAAETSEHTGAPGRPSSMPLILDQAEARREGGKVERSLAVEAEALRQWFLVNHTDKLAPTAKTIENKIRGDHRRYWATKTRN